MTEQAYDPSKVRIGDVIRCEIYNERGGVLEAYTSQVDRISVSVFDGHYSFRNRQGNWFGETRKGEIFYIKHVVHDLEPYKVGDWFKIDHSERRESFEKHREGWWIGTSESYKGIPELKMYKEEDVRYIYDEWMDTDPEAISYNSGDGEPE